MLKFRVEKVNLPPAVTDNPLKASQTVTDVTERAATDSQR